MADLALLLLTLAWGTTFLFVNRVLDVASPGVFLSARFATAAVVLGAVALWRRDRVGAGFLRHGLLLGLFMLAGFVLQTIGLRYTTPARSGFLTGLAVLIVPFFARFLLGRKVRVASWVGVALAVAGLLALTRPLADELADSVRFGDALSAACAVAFALQIVFTAEWAPRHPLVPLTLAQVAVTFAGAVALLPVEGAYFHAAGAGVFAGTVAFTGVLMTAVAFFVQNWGQRHTTAVRAALIFSLEPVAAALFSHLYGGEPLGRADWIGGALIVLGVVAGEVGGALEARGETAGERASP
ncbi:DMT family transporter [Anaeromyxobacter oryzae]|uniref:Transporter n=1 Tax=Anaeromyxobacter oryzae TaxID=2918170 RepID=A0ABM7WVN5_9BACT|nr:DMT family transporter [Anaeromyxobacter oryzae]BDG03573.1 transporter [Anaeromyxobacter oryzae]